MVPELGTAAGWASGSALASAETMAPASAPLSAWRRHHIEFIVIINVDDISPRYIIVENYKVFLGLAIVP